MEKSQITGPALTLYKSRLINDSVLSSRNPYTITENCWYLVNHDVVIPVYLNLQR